MYFLCLATISSLRDIDDCIGFAGVVICVSCAWVLSGSSVRRGVTRGKRTAAYLLSRDQPGPLVANLDLTPRPRGASKAGSFKRVVNDARGD